MSRIGPASYAALHDWTDGLKLPRGEYLREQVAAIRHLLERDAYGRGEVARGALVVDQGPGRITTTPPDGLSVGDAPRDARYWVARLFVTAAKANDAVDFADDNEYPGGPVPYVVTATNLDEWMSGSHLLREGERVWVWGVPDAATGDAPAVGSTPSVRYFFSLAPSLTALIRLTGAAAEDGVYNGFVLDAPSGGIDLSGGATADTLGAPGAACKMVNGTERGRTGHMLDATGAFPPMEFLGTYRGQDLATGLPVYAIVGTQDESCSTGG